VSDPWEQLSLYESQDLVQRKFGERHKLTLSAENAREIVSAVAQAREFFQSAARAAELVRPLLVYYGVLGLSRAAILFLKPGHRESAFKKGHGLRVQQWEEQLATALIRNLPNVRLRFEGGTASELAEVTENKEEWANLARTLSNEGHSDHSRHSDVSSESRSHGEGRSEPATGLGCALRGDIRRVAGVLPRVRIRVFGEHADRH
jgi:hypothetical protein